MMQTTIYAPATPAGIAAIAVIRVSGPQAQAAVVALTGGSPSAARRLVRRRLRDPLDGQAFDDALVAWFPAPRSFTGEDCAEFHLHGSRATLAMALRVLSEVAGLRLARPGEFARRAFDNGKLDLTQVEGLADLIAADTAAQARQAYRQLRGHLGSRCESWRERLLQARAQVEAEIDFPDEDLSGGIGSRLRLELSLLHCEINELLRSNSSAERLREGFSIAILGPPNAGKSSLLNRLAGRDAAIVSAVAGTTRDIVEVALDLGGWPVILADTAGLRALADDIDDEQAVVEREGIRRSLARARDADLCLVVLDGTRGHDQLNDPAVAGLLAANSLLVWNKADQVASVDDLPRHPSGSAAIIVSARQGTGCDALLELLEQSAAEALSQAGGDAVAITRARHRVALGDAASALERAIGETDLVLVGEDLRLAGEAIGRITGRSDVEAMLDVLFSTFCIGK